MRGGLLPPALLFAALGLALGAAPRAIWIWCAIDVVASASVFSLFRFSPSMVEIVFLGCWVSAAVTAFAVHAPHGLSRLAALGLSINAGLWGAAVVSVSGSRLDLASALAFVLVCAPAAWLFAHRAGIAVKVVSSWLIAIAMLAAVLPFLPVTPGYLPDHID